ncbi:MAG TPA: hypothetical protein VK530_02010 [Candidatus Acidoferrum sp.]|nr:hypothetical protein [Candidatus Acidoferrum sp.]
MNSSANQFLLSWVEGTFSLGEVLVVGGILADGSPFRHGATTEFVACMEDAWWISLAEALDRLTANDCDAPRSMWVFEKALLWIAKRVDGAWIGVFTPREISDADREALHSRLVEFIALP